MHYSMGISGSDTPYTVLLYVAKLGTCQGLLGSLCEHFRRIINIFSYLPESHTYFEPQLPLFHYQIHSADNNSM